MPAGKTNILIVGAGKGGKLLIELFYNSETVNIQGVIDINTDAPGMRLAREIGIPTATNYREFLDNKELDEIINVTASELVQEDLLKRKPFHVEVIGGHSAKLIWELIEERRRIESILSWELKVNAAIAELSSAILVEQSFSIDDISHVVSEHARRLTESTFGYVGYIDPHTRCFVSTTLTRDIWEKCHVTDKRIIFEKFSGLWGWVLDNKAPLLTNSPSEDPRSTGIPDGHIPIERFLSAPALIGENLVGQIALANSKRDYTDRDLQLITRFASIYAIAVQRKWSEEKLFYLSMHDALTELYNRSYFEQEMRRVEESRYRSAGIVVCDIDGLKHINDTLGHPAGDEILKASARVIKDSFRRSDVVARIGGDEFAVIIPNADLDSVGKACLRTKDAVSEYNTHHPDLPLSISIGYAVSEKTPFKIYELFKEADNKMYQDKIRRGKKRSQGSGLNI
jgi:diguanylate cyclase (GGDEF)-like protein